MHSIIALKIFIINNHHAQIDQIHKMKKMHKIFHIFLGHLLA